MKGLADEVWAIANDVHLNSLAVEYSSRRNLPMPIYFSKGTSKLDLEQTPQELGLKSDDVITVHTIDPEIIELYVIFEPRDKSRGAKREVCCKVKQGAPFKKMMEVVCQYFEIYSEAHRFYYKGVRILPEFTPKMVRVMMMMMMLFIFYCLFKKLMICLSPLPI